MRPNWFGVAVCAVVLPAVTYWLIVGALHLHDRDIKTGIAALVSLGGLALAMHRYG